MGSPALALDGVAVRRGALGVLMFVAPAYAIARAGASGDELSSWWLLMVGALLFGSMFGGFAAARDRPPTPIAHAAAATAIGLGVVFGVALLIQALRGDLTLAAALTSLVFVQIGIGFGILGGRLAMKWTRV